MRLPCSQAVTLHLRSPPLAVTLHPWLLLTGGYPAHRQLLSQVVMLTCHRRLPYSRPVTLLTGSYPVYGWLPCSRAVTLPTVSYPALVWLLSRAVTLFTDGYLAHGWLPCSQAVTLLAGGYPAHGRLPCPRSVTLHSWRLPCPRSVTLHSCVCSHGLSPCSRMVTLLTDGYPAHRRLPCSRMVTLLTDGYPAHGQLPCSRMVTLLTGGYPTLVWLLSGGILAGPSPRSQVVTLPSHVVTLPSHVVTLPSRMVTLLTVWLLSGLLLMAGTGGYPAHGWLPCTRVVTLRRLLSGSYSRWLCSRAVTLPSCMVMRLSVLYVR